MALRLFCLQRVPGACLWGRPRDGASACCLLLCPCHRQRNRFTDTAPSMSLSRVSPSCPCSRPSSADTETFVVHRGTGMVLLSPAEPRSLKLPEAAWVHRDPPKTVQGTAVGTTPANCSLRGAGAGSKSSLCLPPVAPLHFFRFNSLFPSLCLTFWGT